MPPLLCSIRGFHSDYNRSGVLLMPKFEIGALLELIQRYWVSVAYIKLVLQALNRKASAVGSPPRPSLRFLQRVVFVTSLCFQLLLRPWDSSSSTATASKLIVRVIDGLELLDVDMDRFSSVDRL
ncbi:hypothetical protein RHMOL_Rhmol02G0074900 [Rhododendron molle]|uniref:Uncharacterized protein n=1 Tax=Rhododendron molle TaxID=49168 RepID=A0ACC0PQQ8_RHOML|nr:hypothetical protein RHMOL_Rhmol02G0074900 [Rhododendron molle]